ncbi:MAG: 16S rRNA (uracil(1498)-N(3))-methyltransferase [Phycisphaerae bacterium]
MNLMLLPEQTATLDLDSQDPRYLHLAEVLKAGVGDVIDVGVANGPRGKATVIRMDERGLQLGIAWKAQIDPAVLTIDLIVGLPRPQTARRILREATSLGVRRICFFQSGKGEKSYRDSRLWRTEEWRRALLEGAEQAFHTHVPEVTHFNGIQQALSEGAIADERLALDIYEADSSLPLAVTNMQDRSSISLAIAAERGWNAAERSLLRDQNFQMVHLGPRVLRTEAAVIAALCVVAASQGYWDAPFAPQPDR